MMSAVMAAAIGGAYVMSASTLSSSLIHAAMSCLNPMTVGSSRDMTSVLSLLSSSI